MQDINLTTKTGQFQRELGTINQGSEQRGKYLDQKVDLFTMYQMTTESNLVTTLLGNAGPGSRHCLSFNITTIRRGTWHEISPAFMTLVIISCEDCW